MATASATCRTTTAPCTTAKGRGQPQPFRAAEKPNRFAFILLGVILTAVLLVVCLVLLLRKLVRKLRCRKKHVK